MIWYRPHRGSLADAMKEAKSYRNEDEMKKAVAEYWNSNIGTRKRVLEPEDVVIGEESTNDDRVGWKDVHPVCITRLGEEDFIKEYGCPQCVGHCAYGVENKSVKEQENFYSVQIQFNDDEKCRHFSTNFVMIANNVDEVKEKIREEIPGKYDFTEVKILEKHRLYHPQELSWYASPSLLRK